MTLDTRRLQEEMQAFVPGRDRPLTLTIDGAVLRLTSPEKVLWPAQEQMPAVTKSDLIRYLVRTLPALLPHLSGRPLTAIRYPEGITGPRIFQKNWQRLPGEFVHRVAAPADKPGGVLQSITVENPATLLWLAQMDALEFHPWLSRATNTAGDPFDRPDIVVFDLDPFVPVDDGLMQAKPPLNPAGFAKAVRVALELRELLTQLNLTPYAKTSGKTGVHVYVPIERRYPFDRTRALAEAVGARLARDLPEDVTLAHAIPDRRGKVFIDYSQNGKGKNQVAPYSPRAMPQATVSMPVSWDELPHCYPTDFTIPRLLAAAGRPDPWQDFFTTAGRLEPALDTFGLSRHP